MKVRYQKLSKEKRKEVRKTFYKQKDGKIIKSKLLTGLICGIFLIIIGILEIIYYYFIDYSLFEIIYGLIIYFVGIIFIVSYLKIRLKKINEYVVKNKI